MHRTTASRRRYNTPARLAPPGASPTTSTVREDVIVQDFGRIVCAARSRSRRAISIGSPLSTNLAASSQTSYCAARISSAMMLTARSLWFRLMSPIRYQTLVARSSASIAITRCSCQVATSTPTRLKLGLPDREATKVKMMALNARRPAVAYELKLELHLISLDWFATYRAGLTHAGSARRAVRSSRRQLSSPNRFASLVPKNLLVGHGVSVLSNLAALELPRGIAALVEMKLVYSRCRVRAVELEFDLHLDTRQCLATEGAGLFASRSAGDAVIASRGQFPSANCFSGLFTQQRLIGHCPSSPGGRTVSRLTMESHS